MAKLAECIVEIVIHEHGVSGLLKRLSDPWFFQSMSCVLGYDWHSSGTTTVTCGALKEAINPQKLGVAIAGGKGKTSRKTPLHIEKHGNTMGLGTYKVERLKYASKMAAKVDNGLVQDGYQIYHHCFVFDEEGNWIVIQQGINEKKGNARRYQWPLEHNSFIEEPQGAILCDTRIDRVLNMTSKNSKKNRNASLDISKENPRKLMKMIGEHSPIHQKTLDGWTGTKAPLKRLVMPATINWKAMRVAYDFQPRNYEELISLKGVGPSTIRGLSLVAELLYGEEASWRDPVRFSFAFGGKDGVPFPVDRRAMDESIEILKTAIDSSPMKRNQKYKAIQKLRKCVPVIPEGR